MPATMTSVAPTHRTDTKPFEKASFGMPVTVKPQMSKQIACVRKNVSEVNQNMKSKFNYNSVHTPCHRFP